MSSAVRDVPERGRFELALPDGGVAFARYRESAPGVLAILHVEVPRAVEGRGVGSRVMAGLLDLVRQRGQKVVTYCSFAAAYMRRHPEAHDLLA
jgi:predicted GNAT family acetyltransferase